MVMPTVDTSTGKIVAVESLPSRRYRVPRSCLRCHSLKIRCDKSKPCLTCIKAEKGPACRYPALEFTPRKKRASKNRSFGPADSPPAGPETVQDASTVQPRLSVSSDSLQAHDTAGWPAYSRGQDMTADAQESSLIIEQRPSADSIFSELGHLTASSTITHVTVEQAAFPSSWPQDSSASALVADSPPPEAQQERQLSHGPRDATSRLTERLRRFLPSRWQAAKLWGMYVLNVDCFVKVIHVPTTEAKLYATVGDSEDADNDFIALLFSIFLAAIVSVSDATISAIGLVKATAVSTFKNGIQMCCSQLALDHSPSLNMLQALVIYQVCNRSFGSDCSDWGLVNTVLRSMQIDTLTAQNTGLETGSIEDEFRLRLSWYIRSLNFAYAEENGLIAAVPASGHADIELPHHLNDKDIDSQGIIVGDSDSTGWKDSTFCLIMFEIQKMKEQAIQLCASSDGSAKNTWKDFLDGACTKIRNSYLVNCDKNNPLQLATLLLGNFLLAGSQMQIAQNAALLSEVGDPATDMSPGEVELALEALIACNQLLCDEFLRSFRWYTQSFPLHMLVERVLRHFTTSKDDAKSAQLWQAVCQTLNFTTNPIDSTSRVG